MIAIATYATKNYLYAWPQCVRRIAAAIADEPAGIFIFSTDSSEDAKKAAEVAEAEMPKGWEIIPIVHEIGDDSSENYKHAAQLRIARLQGSAFAAARRQNVDYLWSVESDVLVPPESFKLLRWALEMPGRYYDVAAITYPNAAFLGGFGTPQHPIAPNFLPQERKLPRRLELLWTQCRRRLSGEVVPGSLQPGSPWVPKEEAPKPKDAEVVANYRRLIDRETTRMQRLQKRIEACPPDGNVFEINGKHGYRRRGWFEHAYPGIGRGAVVPVDWVGLGCTLLSKRALSLATFEGYDGAGTQDLFLCWNRWHPEGLHMATVPHVLADHVKPRRDEKGEKIPAEYEHMRAVHHPDGEFAGHLRMRPVPWVPV